MKNVLKIKGGNKLYGEINNQVSKNASLALLSASLICDEVIKLDNLPNLTDIDNMLKILGELGVVIFKNSNSCVLNLQDTQYNGFDKKLASSMRSSIFLLGSMLARFNLAQIDMPGGCKIGSRPIDLSLSSLKKLGVKYCSLGEKIFFDASNKHSGMIRLKIPSVSATENIIEFASTLKGKTIIHNPAREPEVVDMCNFLNSMGAEISGAGSKKIVIKGVEKLRGCTYQPTYDRIVSGTIMIGVALTGGKVKIFNACVKENKCLIDLLTKSGCKIETNNDDLIIERTEKLKNIKKIATDYFPGFPTDLQSQILVLSCLTEGKTKIYERIFENRFLNNVSLIKMGAKIKKIDKKHCLVFGVDELKSSVIKCQDLRGGAALVLAGLIAKGETEIQDIEFIDRGYFKIEDMFSCLGAEITRIKKV